MFFCCVFRDRLSFFSSFILLKLCTTHTQTGFAFFLFFVLSYFFPQRGSCECFFCASLADCEMREKSSCTIGRAMCVHLAFGVFLSLQKREEGETLLVCIWHDVWWMQNWLWSKLEREKEKGKKTSRIFNKVSFHFFSLFFKCKFLNFSFFILGKINLSTSSRCKMQ